MINCAGCDEVHPIPDIIELYVQLAPAPKKPEGKLKFADHAKLLNTAFDDFLLVVKQAGYILNILGGKGPKNAYLPDLDVKLIAPRYRTGFAVIRINRPTQSKLELVQDWLDSYFPDKPPIMQSCVKLHKMEMAFDFKFAEGGSQDDYAALALRLVRSLHMRYSRNSYVIAIVGTSKRCRDKAINGKLTLYLQSAKRNDRYASSDKLQRNIKASKHTKVYLKKQYEIWGLRIECTLSPSALKKLLKDCRMPFDPQNIRNMLQICGMIRFSDFYEFKQCDTIRFARYIPQ